MPRALITQERRTTGSRKMANKSTVVLVKELRYLHGLIESQQPEAANTLRVAADRLETLHRERLVTDRRIRQQSTEITLLERKNREQVADISWGSHLKSDT